MENFDNDAKIRRRVVEERLKNLGIDINSLSDNSRGPVKPPASNSPYSISSVLWFISSVAVFYFSDFARILLYDNRIDRWWLNVGVCFLCVFAIIAVYFIFYLSYVRKLKSDDWDSHAPALIPIATAAFAIASVCLTVGLWPVWRFLTPFILFTLFMGFVVVTAAIPDL